MDAFRRRKASEPVLGDDPDLVDAEVMGDVRIQERCEKGLNDGIFQVGFYPCGQGLEFSGNSAK